MHSCITFFMQMEKAGMKRLIVALSLLLVIVPPVSAQDQTTFTWSPYNFTITLPGGWTATDAGGWLALGLPADVDAVLAGEVAQGAVVIVQVTEPPPGERETLPEYTLDYRLEVVVRQFGDAEWPTVDIPPLGERQGMLVRVADTFLITASAPTDMWTDFVPTLNALVASIQATPVTWTAAERLTQAIAWRELSFMTPENWIVGHAGQDNAYLLTTNYNRLQMAQTFSLQGLIVLMRDYSEIRSLLNPESLKRLQFFWYTPDQYAFGEIEEGALGGFTAASAAFTDTAAEPGTAGRAMLLLTPGSAYLFVGMAGGEQWQASEEALFEAILATLARQE